VLSTPAFVRFEPSIATDVNDGSPGSSQRRCDQQPPMAARRIFLGAEDRGSTLARELET
jgi:hypothetical protein